MVKGTAKSLQVGNNTNRTGTSRDSTNIAISTTYIKHTLNTHLHVMFSLKTMTCCAWTINTMPPSPCGQLAQSLLITMPDSSRFIRAELRVSIALEGLHLIPLDVSSQPRFHTAFVQMTVVVTTRPKRTKYIYEHERAPRLPHTLAVTYRVTCLKTKTTKLIRLTLVLVPAR